MATLLTKQDPVNGLSTYVITATGDYNIGDAHDTTISTYLLNIVPDASSVSLVLKQKIHGSALTADSAGVSVAYYDKSAGSTEVAAGTAITAAKLIEVTCDGCDLILAVGTLSGGNATLRIEARRIRG